MSDTEFVRQYNTQVAGRPFPRVRDLNLSWNTKLEAKVQYWEHWAIPLDTGGITSTGEIGKFDFSLSLPDMTKVFPVFDIQTGVFQNQFAPIGLLYTLLTSILRSHQLVRDGVRLPEPPTGVLFFANPPLPEPEPAPTESQP